MQKSIFEADVQRLIISYEARRHVHLGKVMCRELFPERIAVGEMNGEQRSEVKANRARVPAETVECCLLYTSPSPRDS